MNILAPINSVKEVRKIIHAGADELYCGINSKEWGENYTNVASSNRREWSAANLSSFKQLKQVVEIAHEENVLLYLTVNALYTDKQYPLIDKLIRKVDDLKIDALIVADLGLLIKLQNMNLNIKICISTGGTTFNGSTVEFYKSIGANRIILPRHLTLGEIDKITANNTDMEFEVFIMNSGCKNIDGFCTFHHGVKEKLHSYRWMLPKRLNFDRYILNFIQLFPNKLREKVYNVPCGIDSACLLNYNVNILESKGSLNLEEEKKLCDKIKKAFSLQYGIDTCGACALTKLVHMNVKGVKIVGRNYSTGKKLKDIRFIKTVLEKINKLSDSSHEKIKDEIRKIYKKVYYISCRNLCYYQD